MLQQLDGHVLNLSLALPDGLDTWIIEFIGEASRETDLLRENGANAQATARETLLRKLLGHATTYLDAVIDVGEAAELLGACEETAQRKVREGKLPDLRGKPRGHIRVKRCDVLRLARKKRPKYDPIADAQDVAKLRRTTV